jgi:trigger factor
MIPKNVIESKISKQEIISESIDKQLDKSIREFVTSNKYENELNGTIEASPDVDIVKVDENELIFTARFPTIPSIELPDYKKLNIVVEDVEAAKEEVEHEFDRMIRKDIMLSSKEGPVAMGDSVNIDFKGFDGKKAFSGGEEKDYDLIIGSNSFIPGFEEQLIGMNDGETKTIKVRFPKNYHAAELAGKLVTFEVKINSISSVIKPEFTKEYFSKFKLENIDSEESFKDYLKKQLTD